MKNKLYKISHNIDLTCDYFDSIIYAESDQSVALKRTFEYFDNRSKEFINSSREWPSIDFIDQMNIEYIGETHLYGFVHGSYINS